MYIKWDSVQSLKRKGTLEYEAIRISLEDIMLSEQSETQKDKYCVSSCRYLE